MTAASSSAGVHDFDFFFGSWHNRNEHLVSRLPGSDEWERFDAGGTCRPLLGWAGNVDEFVPECPGREGFAARRCDCSIRRRGCGASFGPTTCGTPSFRRLPVRSSMALASSAGTTSREANPCASGFTGRTSLRPRLVGSRRSRSMTARPGRPIGLCRLHESRNGKGG